MKSPTNQAISDTLRRITVSQLPEDHPRQLAREAVARFRSNAELEGLPVVNERDVHGAPLLDRDGVVRASVPNHAEPTVKTRRGFGEIMEMEVDNGTPK